MSQVPHPTRTEALSAKANQDRMASYVEPEHCAWCEPSPTTPGVTSGVCEPCSTQMEVEIMLERDEFRAAGLELGVPERLVDGLARYVYDRIRPGTFLQAVLTNDLTGAVLRADPESLGALPALCRLIHDEVPMGWYGSERAVAEHLERAAA